MFDIENFLIKESIEYRSSGKNVGKNNVNIKCIFCCEDRFHLSISKTKLVYTCWICGAHGGVTNFVSKLKRISYSEAFDLVNKQNSLSMMLEKYNTQVTPKNKDRVVKLPEFTKSFSNRPHNMFEVSALNYIKKKYDIDLKDIISADIRYCYNGMYKNRIIIPVYRDKELVSFVGRTWDTHCSERYKNCSGINIKKTLYNINNMKKNQDLIVVVEGIFGAIKVGLNHAVATFGTEVSTEQKSLLIDLSPKKLVVMFDNDTNSETNKSVTMKAQKLVDYLSAFMPTKLIKIPYAGKDPADLTREQITKLLSTV